MTRTYDKPGLDEAAPCGQRARVQAQVSLVGAVVLAGLLVLFGVEMAGVHHVAHKVAPEHVPGPSLAWQGYALAVAALLVLKILAHEAGHVLAGAARGLTWLRWGIRASGTPYVGVGGKVRSNVDQLLVSLAGPAADLAVAALLFAANALVGLPGWSPFTVAAWFAVVNGSLGVSLPLTRGCDAARIHRTGWAVVTGRAQLPAVA